MRRNLLGCPVDLMTSEDFLEEVAELIDKRASAKTIQFVNANKIAKIAGDPNFAQLMWRADYVFADGQPMLPIARMLGICIPERIDGIGLMGKLLRLSNVRKYSVFLLGAKQSILESCVDIIRRDMPGVVIAGYRNGYFNPKELPEIASEIRESRADIIFLGMGTPTKEQIADQYKESFGATIIQGVGGSFDVMAGLVPRAPLWMQRIGMEWFFRVMQEPRRMFWRYAVTNAICLRVFLAALFKRLFGASQPATAKAIK